jgi:TIR domain-containing protein
VRRDRVFISYRRADSAGHAGRLRDDLTRLLGATVFMDVADIAPGDDFEHAIDTELSSCGAVLAVIGPRWLEAFRSPRDGKDYVRLELRQALAHAGVTVVPLLVQGATLPPAAELPADIASLASRQAAAIRDDRWSDDVAYLARQLRVALDISPVPRWLVPVGILAGALVALAAWMLMPVKPSTFDRGSAYAIAVEAARKAGVACGAPKETSGTCPVLMEFEPTGRMQNVYYDAGYCDFKGTPFGNCLLKRLESVRVPPFENVPVAQLEVSVQIGPNGTVSVAIDE